MRLPPQHAAVPPLRVRAIHRRTRQLAERGRNRPARAVIDPVSIISDNCWGGEYYRDVRAPYATPFVGLFVNAPCFVRMVRDLPTYLAQPLRFVDRTRYPQAAALHRVHPYPIALLGDVEIHFLHYPTPDDARAAWTRRVPRVRWDNLRFELSDRNDFTFALAEEVLDLPHRTLVLSARRPPRGLGDGAVWIRANRHEPHVVDGATLYPLSKNYVDLDEFLAA